MRDWEAFLKWLATRRAIDRIRRRRVDRGRFRTDDDITDVPAGDLSPDVGAISNELQERLKREISRLPKQQAEAFWLLSVELMSYEEIGEQMGIEVNRVGVLVHRGGKNCENG